MKNSISFPKLEINLEISPVAFHIGSKEIYWYALIILTGFIAGLLLASSTAPKRGVKKDSVWDIALIGITAGIVCARIYYVIFAFDEFKDDLLGIFRIWEGGLAIYGGIIGAVISTAIYCRVKKLNLFNVLDVCCPGLLLGQAIGRWGNFINCEVYGLPTDSLFGMQINGAAAVHPLFLYESVWNLLGVILILLLRDKKKKNGQVFLAYIFWYSCGRLVLEGMRNTSYILYLVSNVIGISQFVSALLIVLSAVGFIYISLSKKKCFIPVPPISDTPEQEAIPAEESKGSEATNDTEK